jgi:hypothetical protein
MAPPWSRLAAALLPLLPVGLAAQGAVDPSVAPRAAQLARAGDRSGATEMLGRYLATAPDDGAAWLQLGSVYLLDTREWHRTGHGGDPDGALLLDFAAAALDQALRLPTDSGTLLRAMVELDRGVMRIEATGWSGAVGSTADPPADPPAYVLEVGRNLLNSCPAGGVLVVGTDLEAVGTWAAAQGGGMRDDLVLLIPVRYAEDSLYRSRMAQALDLPSAPPLAEALTQAAARRPVCLSPTTDSADAPAQPLAPLRLVRTTGGTMPVGGPLSVMSLAATHRARPNAVSSEAAAVYVSAARFNPLLCASVLPPLGARARQACSR